MSKIIPIEKNNPKYVLVVSDPEFGIYYYLVDNVKRNYYSKNDVGIWHIKYKTKLDV